MYLHLIQVTALLLVSKQRWVTQKELSSCYAKAILSMELWYSIIFTQADYSRLQTSHLIRVNAQQIRSPVLKKRIHETSSSVENVNPESSPPKPTKQRNSNY